MGCKKGIGFASTLLLLLFCLGKNCLVPDENRLTWSFFGNEDGHEICVEILLILSGVLIGEAHAKTDCPAFCDVSSNNGKGPVRIIFTFSGLCLDQLGGTCLPKRQPKIVSHQVVFYDVNGTQVCLRLSRGLGSRGNIL